MRAVRNFFVGMLELSLCLCLVSTLMFPKDDVTNIAQKSLLADEKEDVPIGIGLVVWKIPVQTYFLTSLLVLLSVNFFNVK